MTSQTARTKYKWPPYATEWTLPHENFLRTPLVIDMSNMYSTSVITGNNTPETLQIYIMLFS